MYISIIFKPILSTKRENLVLIIGLNYSISIGLKIMDITPQVQMNLHKHIICTCIYVARGRWICAIALRDRSIALCDRRIYYC